MKFQVGEKVLAILGGEVIAVQVISFHECMSEAGSILRGPGFLIKVIGDNLHILSGQKFCIPNKDVIERIHPDALCAWGL